MAGLEEALFALLGAGTAVAAQAGQGIHPVAAPQDVPRPFVVYKITGRTPFAPITGAVTLARARITITAWGDEWKQARDLGDAIAAALDGYDGSGTIQSGRLVAVAEGYDSNAGLFGRSLDVNLIHTE